ncbi:MAG: cobaltochelatase CobT-related protein [Candidatus Hodgkinia cicadicola]
MQVKNPFGRICNPAAASSAALTFELSLKRALVSTLTTFISAPAPSHCNALSSPSRSYKIFTNKFDKFITSPPPSSEVLVSPSGFSETIDRRQLWRIFHDVPPLTKLSPFPPLPQERKLRIVIDRSLSLINHRSLISAFLKLTSRLVASFELIGYTTRHWLGGNSYSAWKRSRIPQPGRVNDVLHLSSDCTQNDLNFRSFMRKSIMKENIDGEAMLSLCSPSKLNIFISDNQSADYRTSDLNSESYLPTHFKSVQVSLPKASVFKLNLDTESTEVGWHKLSKMLSRPSLSRIVSALTIYLSTLT